MNRIQLFVVALVALAALVQLAQADRESEAQVNELDDDQEVDDKLKGGPNFKTDARKKAGSSLKSVWTVDILDQDRHLPKVAEKRKADCPKANTKEKCETCCNGRDKAAKFRRYFKEFFFARCTCYERINRYGHQFPIRTTRKE